MNIFTPFRVGILVIAGIVAFAILFGLSRKRSLDDTNSYIIKVKFNSAIGLSKKSVVRIAGIEVGYIEDIKLEGKNALVLLRIKNNVPIYKDAIASKKSVSVLGDSFVEIDPGTKESGPIGNGGIVTNVISTTGPEAIFKALNDVASDIKEVTGMIRKALAGGEGEGSLNDIIKNMNNITISLNNSIVNLKNKADRMLDKIERFENNTIDFGDKVKGRIKKILKDVEEFSKAASEISKGVKDILGAGKGQMSESFAGIKQNLKKLSATLEKMQVILDKINSGEGTLGRLVNSDTLAKDLEETTKEIKKAIISIRKPRFTIDAHAEVHRFEFPSKQDDKKWYNKSYLTLYYTPGKNNYFIMGIVDNSLGTTRTTLVGNETGQQHKEMRTILEDRLRYNVEFGKYLITPVPMLLRIGMIESTGGLGIDLSLWKNRFTLKTDLFNFGYDLPQLRLSGTFLFGKNIYITGGSDQILNQSKRSFFFGGGIRY